MYDSYTHSLVPSLWWLECLEGRLNTVEFRITLVLHTLAWQRKLQYSLSNPIRLCLPRFKQDLTHVQSLLYTILVLNAIDTAIRELAGLPVRLSLHTRNGRSGTYTQITSLTGIDV